MENTPNDRAAMLREPNFRWLLVGGITSMLGDQFTLIALPWLMLKMTGDSLHLGLVIALMGVPRAIFILLGGAIVDRYSPKRVLMLTKYANTVLLGALAALVLSGQATPALVYALALAIGLASAFSIPSGSAIMPSVVAPQHMQAANSMMMGLRQLTMLAGPVLAGLLIALGGDGAGQMGDARGIGLAFAFDSFTYLFSSWTLARVQVRQDAPRPAPQGLFSAVGEGLAMVWQDRDMRTCFGYWALVMLFVGGAFQVALPVLADTRLSGAGALGLLMGAHGSGTLLGMIVSGVKGKARIGGTLGSTILAIDAIVGALLMPFGFIHAAWQGALLMLVMGALGGFMQVAVFSWVQGRVPPAMLGRAMSIFMFIFMGVAPLSAASAGYLMQFVPLGTLFVGSGAFLIVMAALAFALTPMRRMRDGAAPAPAP
ncbi:MAG: MFS transporter [Pseudomonadota bacterium]